MSGTLSENRVCITIAFIEQLIQGYIECPSFMKHNIAKKNHSGTKHLLPLEFTKDFLFTTVLQTEFLIMWIREGKLLFRFHTSYICKQNYGTI